MCWHRFKNTILQQETVDWKIPIKIYDDGDTVQWSETTFNIIKKTYVTYQQECKNCRHIQLKQLVTSTAE